MDDMTGSYLEKKYGTKDYDYDRIASGEYPHSFHSVISSVHPFDRVNNGPKRGYRHSQVNGDSKYIRGYTSQHGLRPRSGGEHNGSDSPILEPSKNMALSSHVCNFASKARIATPIRP